MFRRSLDSTKNSATCTWGGLTDTGIQSGDVFGFFCDYCHIRGTGSDIFGSDVITAQPFNETAVRAEDFLAVDLARIRDDHRFAATHIQPRN